jgi:hypothetical protein
MAGIVAVGGRAQAIAYKAALLDRASFDEVVAYGISGVSQVGMGYNPPPSILYLTPCYGAALAEMRST